MIFLGETFEFFYFSQNFRLFSVCFCKFSGARGSIASFGKFDFVEFEDFRGRALRDTLEWRSCRIHCISEQQQSVLEGGKEHPRTCVHVEAICFVDWSGGTEEAKEQNYTDRYYYYF
jgi:hypothetical protein